MQNYMMELIGTFFLTVAIALTGNPIAIGLMLMAMIYVGGHVSGGHYNPAISLAVWMRGKMHTNDLIAYCIAQTVGALLGVWLFTIITNSVFAPEMAPGIHLGVAILMEALLVMVLCWVFMTMTMMAKFKGSMLYGFAVGLTLMSIVFVGGLFNPAIALGAMICSIMKNGTFANLNSALIYIGGPLAGGALATFVYQYMNPKA